MRLPVVGVLVTIQINRVRFWSTVTLSKNWGEDSANMFHVCGGPITTPAAVRAHYRSLCCSCAQTWSLRRIDLARRVSSSFTAPGKGSRTRNIRRFAVTIDCAESYSVTDALQFGTRLRIDTTRSRLNT